VYFYNLVEILSSVVVYKLTFEVGVALAERDVSSSNCVQLLLSYLIC
jgi:hypothetical protein